MVLNSTGLCILMLRIAYSETHTHLEMATESIGIEDTGLSIRFGPYPSQKPGPRCLDVTPAIIRPNADRWILPRVTQSGSLIKS